MSLLYREKTVMKRGTDSRILLKSFIKFTEKELLKISLKGFIFYFYIE